MATLYINSNSHLSLLEFRRKYRLRCNQISTFMTHLKLHISISLKTQITFLHGEETFSNKIKHINGNIANLATNSFLHSRVHVQMSSSSLLRGARGYESNLRFNGSSPRAPPFGDLSRVRLRGSVGRRGGSCDSLVRVRASSLKSPPRAHVGQTSDRRSEGGRPVRNFSPRGTNEGTF